MRSKTIPSFSTEGKVITGYGHGAQFMGVEWVLRELRAQAGLTPFAGTLNLRIPPSVWDSLFERRASFLKIEDSSAADCPGYIRRVILTTSKGQVYNSAYLILPERTTYKDVLEIIAVDNLRQTLGLKDGDVVRVEEFPKG